MSAAAGHAAAWHAAERAARAALATHEQTAELATAVLTPIVGSVSNFAWHAVAGSTERFVRLARAGNEALGADRVAEAAILRCVAAAGLAPKVLRCDPAARLLVTQWITPNRIARSTLQDEVSLEQVAAAMARLHRLDVPAGVREVRFDEQARRLEARGSHAQSVFTELASVVFERLAHDAPVVLCHNDLHAQNIVFDTGNRLWLVDWEYAGLGDPVFDLASFASQCALSRDAGQRLCDEYIRAGGRVEWSRVEFARWAFDYVQWLWYEGLRASAEPGPDGAEAMRRSRRIEQSLLERASGVLRCNNR